MDVRTLADRYWDEILETNPVLATQVGDERFDDRLPDPSPEGIERRRKVHAAALVETAFKLSEGTTDAADLAILDTVEAIAEPEIAAIDLGMHRFEPIDQLWGPGTLLDQLASIQHAETPDQVERYLRRLRGVDAYLHDCADLLLKNGSGIQTAPALIVDRCIRQVEKLLDTPPEGSPALRPLSNDDAQARSRATEVLRSITFPAYGEFLTALRTYRERARDTIGLLHLSRGDEMYRLCVKRSTSLSLDPLELHEIGRIELDKIQAERLALAQRLGAADPATAISAHNATGRNSFRSREEILKLAQDQVRRGWERAHDVFGRLPQRNCEVRPVDPSREADVLEFYLPAAADGSRPGIYYVNTANPRQRHRHSLASTTFHETNPGHHLQMALDQEQTERPALLRFGGELAGLAFVEGWGLYAERLADEMNLFADDYERLGMLELQALRAARLVVDTGLHALGWSRLQVIVVLENTGLDSPRAALEADRYVAMPGQALAYKVGQMEIEAHRRQTEQKEGTAFALSDFHDRVLGLGAVPLTTFRRELSGGHRDPKAANSSSGDWA
jgi:uncharacterized protein (DUF885 family)